MPPKPEPLASSGWLLHRKELMFQVFYKADFEYEIMESIELNMFNVEIM